MKKLYMLSRAMRTLHILCALILLTMMANTAFAKQQQASLIVSGQVTDKAQQPLPGATIVVKGSSSQGTVTDSDGRFSLSVEDNAVLIFSFVGYTTQELSVNGQSTLSVNLEEESGQLEEVIVVGYGVQKKINVTGSVASVKSDDINVAPLASTANTLAGRLPGLISLQSSGRPGYDAAGLSIRGFGNALIIVDGIQTSFNNIDPNQIESISVLKDGSASIYGSRAGNGVILITTKRGITQKPVIKFNTSYSLQGITAYSKGVNAGQYAELTNERYRNQGLTEPYSPDQVQKYYNGTDPQYPSTDWYKEVIRDWAPQQKHDISVQGGSEKIKYFGLFGFVDQEYMWKKNGGNYSRYNLQSNIDASVTDNFSVRLDLSSIYENRLSSSIPQDPGTSSTWQTLWNTLPIYPARLPDPNKLSYANGVGIGAVTYATDMDIVGFSKGIDHNLKGTFVADLKIPQVKGLSARGFINYQQTYSSGKQFVKPYEFYTYNYGTDEYTLVGAYGTAASLKENRYMDRNITGQLSLNYENTFRGNHFLKAMLLYEAIDYKSDALNAGRDAFVTPAIEYMFGGAADRSTTGGYGTEMGRASYVGRLNYTYREKYLLESSLRADASAQFPAATRWGYFPSVSLGWRIANEDFMKGLGSLDDLKLRASYGSSGQDNVSNFAYISGYQLDGQWLIGAGTQKGIASTGVPNPNLTWEKIEILNGGLDLSLWQGKLTATGDVFYRTRTGIPATRILSVASTFGANLPPENLNSQNTRGFELSLGTGGKVGNLTYNISSNISWSRSQWDHFEEPTYTDADQDRVYRRSNRWTDVQFGYVSNGLFTSPDQISNLGYNYPGGNTALGPGDIHYADVNADGVLDWKDQVEIGKGTVPHWISGTNINLRYANFDLVAQFQGAFGYYSYVTLDHGNLTYPVEVYNLRWSESNNQSSALIPRVGGSSTNQFVSDYYYKNASYMRLKVLSFGYSLPKSVIERANLQQFRIYFAGTNLWTISKVFKEYNVDPEAPSNNAAFYYPQQKTVTLGLNISF